MLDPSDPVLVVPAPAPPPALALLPAEAPAPPRRRGRRARIVSWAAAGLVLLVLAAIAWLAVTAPLSRSLQPIAPRAVTLLSADGTVIARRGAIVGRPVDARLLPPHVRDAFVAIEDRRFFHHGAIDPRGILRAAWHNLRAGGVREGGSTITQQLAKQVFLTADRTAARKAKEVLIAIWMEAWLTKDEILSRYLSEVYFGDNVYGLRAAARHYFDEAPERLSVAEAAMLAGMMKAPSRLAPSTNLAAARARGRLVMAAMADAGLLPAAAARTLPDAVPRLVPVPAPTDGTYFADWVLPAARERMGDDPGVGTIRTTLDARLQRAAERAVARAALGGTRTGRGAQIALVAMRPDGRVVAMVGGRSYADSPFNRAAQARRQPGSTFKLFVYLAAFRAGLTPDSRIADRPITIGGWSPANADHRYRGDITLRDAFARSSNVAAVRLARRVGPGAVVRAARDLGIASPLDAGDPSIALGTSGVTLLELTSAYAAVAGGTAPVRARGLPDARPGWLGAFWDARHAIEPDHRRMLLDLLSATVNQGTGRAAALSTQVFGKTGTSQGGRDAIFVGFSGGLVTAVWIGRDDNRPLAGMAGGGPPARVWRSFMADATGARPIGARAPAAVDPDAAADAGVDLDLGNLADALRIGRAAYRFAHDALAEPRRARPAGNAAGADRDDDAGDDPPAQ